MYISDILKHSFRSQFKNPTYCITSALLSDGYILQHGVLVSILKFTVIIKGKV